MMVSSVYFVKSTPLTPSVRSFKNIEDKLQTFMCSHKMCWPQWLSWMHVRHPAPLPTLNIVWWRLMKIDHHEIFSKVILSPPLIQEEQLSVSGKRMCTKYWFNKQTNGTDILKMYMCKFDADLFFFFFFFWENCRIFNLAHLRQLHPNPTPPCKLFFGLSIHPSITFCFDISCFPKKVLFHFCLHETCWYAFEAPCRAMTFQWVPTIYSRLSLSRIPRDSETFPDIHTSTY